MFLTPFRHGLPIFLIFVLLIGGILFLWDSREETNTHTMAL